MGVRTEEFVIIALVIPEGIDEEVASAVSARMNKFNPDYWDLFQPDSYTFYFRQKKGGNERAAKGIILLESLKSVIARLKTMRIGKASGPLTADFSLFGRIKSSPLGLAAIQANSNART